MGSVLPLKLTAPDLAQFVAGTDFVGPTIGGTGQTSYTTGDILYSSSSNVLSKLGIGSSGQVLTVSGGIPAWVNVPAGSYIIVSLTNGNGSSITKGQAVYYNGTADTVDLAKADNITTSRVIGLVFDTSIASSASGNIIITGICPSAITSATAGTVYYLSDSTAGALTTTAPSTTGHVVVPVGIADDTTDLFIQIKDLVKL